MWKKVCYMVSFIFPLALLLSNVSQADDMARTDDINFSDAVDVQVYPRPDESIEQSEMYQVDIIQGGVRFNSFVYQIHAQHTVKWRHNICSFTTFSFSEPVTAEVTKLGGEPIRTCRIYPSSYGITPEIVSSTKVSFTITEPMKKIAVIFNDDWITHPLLIFADPLQTYIPVDGDSNVIYFEPGVHDAGIIEPAEGQVVYIAGGAYVKGAIRAENKSNVKITGRGILSQENMAFHEAHSIELSGWVENRNCLVEGITIIQQAFFGIVALGTGINIRNVKLVGCWQFNNDGVDAPSGGIVEDCFFKCNDDAIKVNFRNTVVRRNVIWQMENGAVFQISWNITDDNSNFHIYDCDIIRTEHQWDNPNLGIIVAHHSGAGNMSGYLFEDIRVENARNRLFNIHLFRDPQYYDISAGNGEVSDIIIRNFTATDCNLWRPEIIAGIKGNPDRPADANVIYYVHDITFEDLRINDELISNAESGNFDIDPNTTYNITFMPPGSYRRVIMDNFSFEFPGTIKQTGFDNVLGWSTDGPVIDSGVETGYTPTDGDWIAYLFAPDPSIWQLTCHTIEEGDVFELKVDSRITWGAKNLLMSLYYDDDGIRIQASTREVRLTDQMQEYTLVFTAADIPESIGHNIGIEFDNISGPDKKWIGLDNVRLNLID